MKEGMNMSDKILVEVTDADIKALSSAIAAIKAKASSFGDTGSVFLEDLVPLKALRKRAIAAQTAAASPGK
jgi:uncharacterized 2Fe-2S/4Fe-4S cluster protein (DUF4445 family)